MSTNPDENDTDDADTESRSTATVTDPDADGPAVRTTGVYTPYRRVVVTTGDGTEIPLDGVDLDVTITHRDRGCPTWSVTAFDLAPRVWDHLRGNASVAITVGWRNGPQRTAVRGPVQLLRPQSNTGTRGGAAQRGPRYLMRGITHAGARLGQRVARTWQNELPAEIVRDTAKMANLEVGAIAVDVDDFANHWTITTGRTLRGWLDKLADSIARREGHEWTWYTRDGALFFVPRGTPTAERVQLTHRNAARRYPTRRGATTPRDTDALTRSFSRTLEPAVQRGATVAVGQPDEATADSTLHVVTGYQFESSSLTGRHYVHGSLTPRDAEYGHQFPELTGRDGVDPVEPDG